MANLLNNHKGEQLSIANSRILYEDVVRKNQEIIKQILSKINDLYSRQEDFDFSFRTMNEKISRINEATQELHHQFRANQIEIERKHQGFINDLNGIKGALKIPDANKDHEEYLSSQFFKQHVAVIRTRSRGKIRHKTNFKQPQEAEKAQKGQRTQNHPISCQNKPKLKRFSQNKKQKIEKGKDGTFGQQQKEQFSNTLAGIESKQDRQYDSTEILINEKISQLQQKLQFLLNNSKDEMKIKHVQLDSAFKALESQVQGKFEKISKNLNRQDQWSQINFQQLQNYLSTKIKEQLHQKLSRKYFQESLTNLKQSWQEELNQIYEVLNKKQDQICLKVVDDRISQLRSQLELFNNLNSIKIQNLSYNSTCKSTPQRFSPTERNSYGETIDNVRVTRQQEEKKFKKTEMLYSNSCSSFSRTKETKKSVLEDKEHLSKTQDENMSKWKNRVMETLGLTNKKVRRIKRSDQFTK